MSSSEERLLILKMLEQGKISSEEASRLLEALEGTAKNKDTGTKDKEREKKNYKQIFPEEVNNLRDKLNDWKKEFKKAYKESDFDKVVDDFTSKAEKIAKTVTATTFEIVDKVIDTVGSFVDTSAFNIFGNFKLTEKSFELEVPQDCNFSIEGINGQIILRKHLSDKIIVNTKIRCPESRDDLVFCNCEGSNVSINVNKDLSNLSVQHEVFIPSSLFESIHIHTTNSGISVQDVSAKEFTACTKNAHIDLLGLNAESAKITTTNGRIFINYVVADKITINTTNSVIDIKNIKTSDIQAFSTNGIVRAENILNRDEMNKVDVLFKTSNGRIKIDMNDMSDKGYKIKAKTSNASINLLVPRLTYHTGSSTHGSAASKSFGTTNVVEAESLNYENSAVKVNIIAETSNADIEIVK